MKLSLLSILCAASTCISVLSGNVNAETLNPEGVNPHAEAPRKRITQEQKLAASEAMKKKKAEIEARKAAAAGKVDSKLLNQQPVITDAVSGNAAK